jgi:hypothetical protein
VLTVDGLMMDRQNIVVVDALGRSVMSLTVSGTSATIDLGQLPAGPYAIRIGSTIVPVIRR